MLTTRFSVGVSGGRRFGIPVLFALIAAPVFVLIAFLVVHVEQNSSTETLIRTTENQNETLARAMANSHFDRISYLLAFDIGDAPELLPIALKRSGLNESVRASLDGTNVENLKIYDGNGITLFSLDGKHLGEDISACECFAEVLNGTTVSELIRFNEPHHTANHIDDNGTPTPVHTDAEVDILSTLIQVNVLSPHLVASDGVLEIQSDVSLLIAAIEATNREIYFTIGVPLAALYLAMVLLVVLVHGAYLRREEEARLLAAKAAESDAANRAKSEFLSLMSHELRTPLNAIIGFSELIEQGEKSEQGEPKNGETQTGGFAKAIHESGHHMLRQISSILDMTAIELGDLELDDDLVDLEDTARQAASNVAPAFDRGQVILRVEPAQSGLIVRGDTEKLRQVFENLLANSARFTPAGGQVDVSFAVEPDGFISAAIRDNGVGMTPEQAARAREPFLQDWNGMSREADGAGLGLTIADKVVTQLGGELTIDSAKHVGTRIVIRLPVVTEPHRGPAETADQASTVEPAILKVVQ